MSLSRSATTVTIAADASTFLARSAVSIQRRDSRSDSGRSRCGSVTTPSRVRTSPPTKPRQAWLSASTAIPRLRRGMHRVRHNPVCVAFLHRPQATAALCGGGEFHLRGVPRLRRGMPGWPICAGRQQPHRSNGSIPRRSSPPSPPPSQGQALWLAKNRPACSSPPRLPPSRRKQTVLRATIRSRIAPPLYRGAHPRMIQATIPSRLLFSGCRKAPNRTRAASGKQFLRFDSIIE